METFSCYHRYLATALAREMNEYFEHSEYMRKRFEQKDKKGNPPVYTKPDYTKTQELRLKIILLTANYIEALVNHYLSIKLDAEEFERLERRPVLKKWMELPKQFLPDYVFPRDGAMYDALDTLIGLRNAAVHMKPRIMLHGEVLQKGNHPEKFNIQNYIEKWDRLPRELIEHLGEYDTSLKYMKFRALTFIDDYSLIRGGKEPKG